MSHLLNIHLPAFVTIGQSGRGGEFEQRIQAIRDMVVNRVESSAKANIFLATASHPTWPLLVAGRSGQQLLHRIAVVENQCFSFRPDCGLREGGDSVARMPSGHSYQEYNISSIYLRSGLYVDFIKVTYKHRTTGKELYQQFGNPNGGDVPADGTLVDILNKPVVKAQWWSVKEGRSDPWQMRALQFTQNSTKSVRAGRAGGEDYVDDYSGWKGAVWLCGMDIHGEAGKRVQGIGPRWCYMEGYLGPAPSPPPNYAPPPSPCSWPWCY